MISVFLLFIFWIWFCLIGRIFLIIDKGNVNGWLLSKISSIGRIVRVSGKEIMNIEFLLGLEWILMVLLSFWMLVFMIFMLMFCLEMLEICDLVEKLGRKMRFRFCCLFMVLVFFLEISFFFIVLVFMCLVFMFLLLLVMIRMMWLFFWCVFSWIRFFMGLLVICCLVGILILWLMVLWIKWISGLVRFLIIVLLIFVFLLVRISLIFLFNWCVRLWVICGYFWNNCLIGCIWVFIIEFCRLEISKFSWFIVWLSVCSVLELFLLVRILVCKLVSWFLVRLILLDRFRIWLSCEVLICMVFLWMLCFFIWCVDVGCFFGLLVVWWLKVEVVLFVDWVVIDELVVVGVLIVVCVVLVLVLVIIFFCVVIVIGVFVINECNVF